MISQAIYKSVQLSVRAGAGAGLSAAFAMMLGLQYPIYAFLAAVIVTDLSPSRTRQLGLRRIIATVVGAGLGAALIPVTGTGPWALGLGVLIAMQACYLLKMDDGAKVAGYICGIVLLEHGAEAWSYALFRLIETVLGIGVATSISFVPKLIRIEEHEPRNP
jgi:uncharacterized membrane protein YgaE (UPF0421/DUF939 family)